MGKYIRNNGGNLEEVLASNTGGAPAANTIPRLDSNGRLDATMMPVGIGADTEQIVASENLAAGDFVNVFANTGVANVRKADASVASAGRIAHGFVLSAFTAGQTATVYFEGTNTGASGLTIGSTVFLSGSTAGQGTSTAPTTAGHSLQRLGVAVSATRVNVEIGRPIILA